MTRDDRIRTIEGELHVTRLGRIRRGGASQGGFSLLEVLIALLVLAIGLLGLALMQTLNLRYTKSAEQRTQAVNLAGAMLDIMRTNSSQAPGYVVAPADFAAVDMSAGCAGDGTLDADGNRGRWICEVRKALGPGAAATVTYDGASRQATVTVTWPEEGMASMLGSGSVLLVTTL